MRRVDSNLTGSAPNSWGGKRWAMALVVIMVAAACGGDPSEVSQPTEAEPSTSAGEDPGGAQDGQLDDPTDTPSAPVATVSIGDETFTFSHEGFAASSNCRPDDNGTFHALLLLVDENGDLTVRSDLDLTLLHEGTVPDANTKNSVRVRLGHLDDGSLDYSPGWFADAASTEQFGYPPGASQVDSFVIDGNTATGTATFVDGESDAAFARGEVDSVESVQGTFTVTCSS